MSKGLQDSATLLQKEANLSLPTNNTHLPSKFRYATPVTPNRVSLCRLLAKFVQLKTIFADATFFKFRIVSSKFF